MRVCVHVHVSGEQSCVCSGIAADNVSTPEEKRVCVQGPCWK